MNTSIKPVHLPILLATNREGRISEHVAKLLFAEIEKRNKVSGDITTELIDVRNFDLPQDDYGQSIKDRFATFRDTIIASDGLIIVLPEYNHGIPGVFKSVLDMLETEYHRKALGVAGVSSGPWGGVRAIESFMPIARYLGLVATPVDLQFPFAGKLFSEHGEFLQADEYESRFERFFDEVIWMAKTLQVGRANHK